VLAHAFTAQLKYLGWVSRNRKGNMMYINCDALRQKDAEKMERTGQKESSRKKERDRQRKKGNTEKERRNTII
jgi:hypothetical protein